jgi:hypothetical protein
MAVSAAAAVGVVGVARKAAASKVMTVWVAAVVVAVAVVEGEAMVVTSTLGRMVMTTSPSRTGYVL